MRMYDIIAKKRNNLELTLEEISFFVNGFTNGDIPDYQVSALLMAIYFNGMTDLETALLTSCIAKSGDMVDLSKIDGIKVDKHSTGGVGDKTTLIIAPIVAACGVKVAKMSGRGLGHTGGTIDKLESIPNFETSLSHEKFFEIVNRVGVSVIGQTGNLAPADKKLYALRDVTATVDSIPLIAASIMSKKIAAGADCILLDVKTGSGAFMKTLDDSIKLAKAMVDIGENVNRHTIALITNMDIPLGNAIGNSLEVIEAVETLKGNGPKDLTYVCIELATNMLFLAKRGTIEECKYLVQKTISDGSALKKFIEMVKAQNGDISVIENTNNFEKPKYSYQLKADCDGYIFKMDTENIGIASVVLGAGRDTKDSKIDYSAGIILNAKYGDKINKDDVIATLYSSDEAKFEQANDILQKAIIIKNDKPLNQPLIYAKVLNDKIEKYI